jgi:bidirectional [NiFe] hydrogenase diaphorase subunit
VHALRRLRDDLQVQRGLRSLEVGMVRLSINGKAIEAKTGTMLLKAARENGFEIPALCDREPLEPYGACRVCLVEITHPQWKGWRGLVTACLYPVEEGLIVYTDNEVVYEARKAVLDLLLARCPHTPLIQELAARYGLDQTTLVPRAEPDDCIMCTLCTRICAYQGTSAISTVNRGLTKEIAPPLKERPEDCTGCLNCALICPTGHIKYEERDGKRKIWDREFSLIRCEVCGAPTTTVDHRDFLVTKGVLKMSYFLRCEKCKQQDVAKTLVRVGKVEEANA